MAYDFGLGTADNGDVKAIVNNRDNTRTQYFSYDALNRIVLANTQTASGANAWGQAFGYDPWGNLTSTTVTQGSAPNLNVSVNANNQVSGAPFSYDAAGNLLTDALNTYTWSAEGKMATVSSAQGSVTYSYDGDGKRVQKSNGKLYWYGADGNVVAESDASGNIRDEYIFFGGNRLARVDASGKVDYYLSDSLSSARVVTDVNGNILDDCDFLPFGNEQCVSSSSGNTYKFTGKERDTESSNDYFSARYYSSQYNRFASPDPESAGADPSNPQSWNAYSYAGNNPTTNADPTGEDYNVCTIDQNTNQTCTRVTDDVAFEQALNSPGPGLTVEQGSNSSGTIYTTNPNTGQEEVAGTFQWEPPTSQEEASVDVTNNVMNSALLLTGVGRLVTGALSLGEGLLSGVRGFFADETSSAVGAEIAPKLIGPGEEGVSLTEHALERALQRGITQQDINDAVRSAKAAGQVVTQVGKYGTPQQAFTGKNNVVVVVGGCGDDWTKCRKGHYCLARIGHGRRNRQFSGAEVRAC